MVCGDRGCFGVTRRDDQGNFNKFDPADWYCQHHVPFLVGQMRHTWVRKFEDAFLNEKRQQDCGGPAGAVEKQ